MARDCPVCGLVNPDTSAKCDCGFNFEGGPEALKEANVAGRGKMILGGFLFIVGSLIIALTVTAVERLGGMCVVWWGLPLAGLALFFRGLSQYWKTKNY